MPYFIIDKKPIFMSWKRNGMFREEFFKANPKLDDNLNHIAIGMKGETNNMFQEFQYNMIEKEYLDNPAKFESDWFEFDLRDEEASNDVWHLLYDYCCYYGHADLSNVGGCVAEINDYCRGVLNLRDRAKKTTEYYRQYPYPTGKVFTLSHVVKPEYWWWRFTCKMKERVVRVIVDVEKVKRLKGNLQHFVVEMDNCKLICCENFEICPK